MSASYTIGPAAGLNYHNLTGQLSYTWNFGNSNTYDWTSGVTPVIGQWNFAAIAIRQDYAKLYDYSASGGFQSAVNAIAHQTQSFGNQWYIGLDPGGTRFFDGLMDDVRIYHRALSDAEVMQLYKMGGGGGGNAMGHSNIGISNGLVGYWTFDGPNINWNTNTFYDISGFGNNATSTGASTSTTPVQGKIGQALDFNNNGNTYLGVAHSSSLDVTTITVAVWAKLSPTVGSWRRFVGEGPDDTEKFGLWKDTNGKFEVEREINGSQLTGLTSSRSINDNKWHQLVYTYNGSTEYIYIDGSEEARNSVSGTMTLDGYVIGIEREYVTYSRGQMDDVRIYNYNRALSATEVTQLYNAGR
jgi:Concanavalin A-like lectin/glucanases superfamily